MSTSSRLAAGTLISCSTRPRQVRRSSHLFRKDLLCWFEALCSHRLHSFDVADQEVCTDAVRAENAGLRSIHQLSLGSTDSHSSHRGRHH